MYYVSTAVFHSYVLTNEVGGNIGVSLLACQLVGLLVFPCLDDNSWNSWWIQIVFGTYVHNQKMKVKFKLHITLKIFLSEVTRPRAIIYSLWHHLMVLYQNMLMESKLALLWRLVVLTYNMLSLVLKPNHFLLRQV